MYLGVVLNPLARKNRKVGPDDYARIERLVAPWGEVVRTPSLAALRPAVSGCSRKSRTSSATAATARCTGW
jgi:hypothetical protein